MKTLLQDQCLVSTGMVVCVLYSLKYGEYRMCGVYIHLFMIIPKKNTTCILFHLNILFVEGMLALHK